jgi:hypothetical protein
MDPGTLYQSVRVGTDQYCSPNGLQRGLRRGAGNAQYWSVRAGTDQYCSQNDLELERRSAERETYSTGQYRSVPTVTVSKGRCSGSE